LSKGKIIAATILIILFAVFLFYRFLNFQVAGKKELLETASPPMCL